MCHIQKQTQWRLPASQLLLSSQEVLHEETELSDHVKAPKRDREATQENLNPSPASVRVDAQCSAMWYPGNSACVECVVLRNCVCWASSEWQNITVPIQFLALCPRSKYSSPTHDAFQVLHVPAGYLEAWMQLLNWDEEKRLACEPSTVALQMQVCIYVRCEKH